MNKILLSLIPAILLAQPPEMQWIKGPVPGGNGSACQTQDIGYFTAAGGVVTCFKNVWTPLTLTTSTIGAGSTQLPAAAAANANWVTVVTDGSTTSDCTIGGGTTRALCVSSGSAWVALGGSAAGGSSGQVQINNGGAFAGINGFVVPNNSTTGASITANLPSSGWTQFNSPTNVNDFALGFIDVMIKNSGGVNLNGITWPITVPYTLYALVECTQSGGGGTQDCGLEISDGTKYEGLELEFASGSIVGLRTLTYTNANTLSAAGAASGSVGHMVAFKLVNNGTNRIWSYWNSGSWGTPFLTEASGTFLTETQAGIGGWNGASNTNSLRLRLFYWWVQ